MKSSKGSFQRSASATRFLGLVAAALVLGACASTPAKAVPGTTGSPESPALVLDPTVREGKLPNGLSYAIRENDDPKGRLFLRLVVKIGSLDESDGERGVAHFLEHMAFNGTKSFPKDELVRYMESIGMNFGAEVNASTGYAKTEYRLEVPCSDPAVVDKAFLILREWADSIRIESSDVVGERGVVLEEERLSRGVGERLRRKSLPAIYGDSRYARREVIGTAGPISNMNSYTIRSFYETWYRPELMGVFVAGDLPAEEIEERVKRSFGEIAVLPGPAPASRDIGAISKLGILTFSDPELGLADIRMALRLKPIVARNEAEYLDQTERDILRYLLATRLAEALRRSGGSDFSSATIVENEISPDCLLFSVNVGFEGKAWGKALAALRAEIARVGRDGFLQSEIDRSRKIYSSELENLEKNGRSSAAWTTRLASAFERGHVFPSNADRRRLEGIAFARIDKASATDFAALFEKGEERLIVLQMPASAGELPSSEEIERALSAPPAMLAAWKEEKAAVLLKKIPAPVTPVSVGEEAGVVELVYANGLKVLLKRSDFESDQIAMRAMALRGSNCLDEAGFANAMIASALIPVSGFEDLSADTLKSTLAGVKVSLRASISEDRASLNGSSDRAGLETLFQLIRRTLSDPVVDPGYLSMGRKRLADAMMNYRNNPNMLFMVESSRRLYPGNESRNLMFTRPEDFDLLDAAKARALFLNLLSPPEGIVFAFAGSFHTETIRALCDRYLGSLPSRAVPGALVPGNVLSAGAETATIRAGMEDKALVGLYYKTPGAEVDPATVEGLDLIAAALSRALRERIREKAGGTYDPSVISVTNPSSGQSVQIISFGADPARVEELVAATKEEVARIASAGVPEGRLEEVVLAAKKNLEKNGRENGFWADNLAAAAVYGWPLSFDKRKLARLDSITVDWTREAARKYYDPANLAEYVLLPATKK